MVAETYHGKTDREWRNWWNDRCLSREPRLSALEYPIRESTLLKIRELGRTRHDMVFHVEQALLEGVAPWIFEVRPRWFNFRWIWRKSENLDRLISGGLHDCEPFAMSHRGGKAVLEAIQRSMKKRGLRKRTGRTQGDRGICAVWDLQNHTWRQNQGTDHVAEDENGPEKKVTTE